MIEYLLAGLTLGILAIFLDEVRKGYQVARRNQVEQSKDERQAAWDAHVADALELSETPIHDRLAAELSVDIDAEWAQLNGADQ